MAGEPGEGRERWRALWRFVMLALQPWPSRWPRMTEFVIAAAGAVAGIVAAFAVRSPLTGLTVFLAVATLLLLWAGTRAERELRGDADIGLTMDTSDQHFRLSVENSSGQWAEFRADVTAVLPESPDVLSELPWAISWEQGTGKQESIGPHATQYLHVAGSQVTANLGGQPPDRQIIFQTFTGKKMALDAESPITMTVTVSRVGSRRSVTAKFKVWLDADGYPRAAPA